MPNESESGEPEKWVVTKPVVNATTPARRVLQSLQNRLKFRTMDELAAAAQVSQGAVSDALNHGRGRFVIRSLAPQLNLAERQMAKGWPKEVMDLEELVSEDYVQRRDAAGSAASGAEGAAAGAEVAATR